MHQKSAEPRTQFLSDLGEDSAIIPYFIAGLHESKTFSGLNFLSLILQINIFTQCPNTVRNPLFCKT